MVGKTQAMDEVHPDNPDLDIMKKLGYSPRPYDVWNFSVWNFWRINRRDPQRFLGHMSTFHCERCRVDGRGDPGDGRLI
jgi:hypothetical protein